MLMPRIRLLQIFAAWPEPLAPVWTTFLPIDIRIGRAASTATSSPPAMKVRVPASAPATPPETGESRNCRPRFLAASRDRAGAVDIGGRAVDQQRAGLGVGHDAVIVEIDDPQLAPGRQHADDDVVGRRQLHQARRLLGALRHRLGVLGVGVEHGDLVAGLQQVARHGAAHVADADETDAGHDTPPSESSR